MTGPEPMGSADPFAPLLDLKRDGVMWRIYPVPEARVMFVQVNKNACTSLKWMIAGIAGEDLDGFKPGLEATTESDDIHDRRQWRKSPRLDAMTPEQRAEIHPDNGWFVFAVTRDPRSRLFSAWQSKLLLENPGYFAYRSQPWYPRHPLDAGTVVEDFETFVDLLEREPDHRIWRDAHFRRQVDLLYLDVITYSEIYDIAELGRMQDDLRKHLDSVGWSGELNLPRLNDTSLRPNPQAFAGGLRERIEKLYAADFERFGDRWDYAKIDKTPEWTDEELREAELRAAYGRRLGHLRSKVIYFRARAREQSQRADAEKATADALRQQVSELDGALTASVDEAPVPELLRAVFRRAGQGRAK